MRHYSTRTMIERLSGMLGTNDLTEWEARFVADMKRRLDANEISDLSERQLDALEAIHTSHFA